MFKRKSLCLAIASLMLAGCATSTPPSPLQIPPLDTSLGYCVELPKPSKADYDAWQSWATSELLKQYGNCASAHRKVVDLWKKMQGESEALRAAPAEKPSIWQRTFGGK